MDTADAAAYGELLRTALYGTHDSMGAKMAPFAGWAMPVEYEGTLTEHEAVRSDVGVFDVSHLGTVWVTGEGATDTVAACFTNDPTDVRDGGSQYTLCANEDGGIDDDLIVYRIGADRWLVIPNAANTATVVEVLRHAAGEHGARIIDESRTRAVIAVQGPRSLELVDRLFPDVLGSVGRRGTGRIDLGPADDGWLCRTGYTGEDGVELVLAGNDAPGVFTQLLALGATPCGLAARDTLRLEMGYPLHGNDLTAETDPFEAGLGWAVDLDGRDFRGRAGLERRRRSEPGRHLRGLLARDRGIPRHGMSVHRDGRQVGTVTSGTFSPTLRNGIALAYVEAGVAVGHGVEVDVRGKRFAFEVVDPPFVHRDG